MNKRVSWLIVLIYAWLAFVVSLTVWWLIFTIRTIRLLSAYEQNPEILQKQNMIIMEGSVLILFLLFGGGALIHFAHREKKRFEEVRLFFSAFSHDLKTSISKVILQAETLVSGPDAEKAKGFHKNLMALELQLENSLQYSQADSRQIVNESVELKNVVARLHTQWPDLKINLQGKVRFNADAVALESIFKNLVSNAVLHGGADEIILKSTAQGSQVTVVFSDNGKAFTGDVSVLGAQPVPSQKGSGLGLYLVRQWVERLKGKIDFSRSETGSLVATVQLPGAPL